MDSGSNPPKVEITSTFTLLVMASTQQPCNNRKHRSPAKECRSQNARRRVPTHPSNKQTGQRLINPSQLHLPSRPSRQDCRDSRLRSTSAGETWRLSPFSGFQTRAPLFSGTWMQLEFQAEIFISGLGGCSRLASLRPCGH